MARSHFGEADDFRTSPRVLCVYQAAAHRSILGFQAPFRTADHDRARTKHLMSGSDSGGPRRRPTIRDVAARAGVSPATVSSVVTGLRPVADESRRNVVEAIEALGFRPNHMASSLRAGRSQTVGVVVPNLANEFYSGLVRHFERDAAKSGFELLVVASEDDPGTEAARIESLIARRVDGLLIVPARDQFGDVVGFPRVLPPLVLLDRAFGHPSYDTVASDNFAAGKLGCDHLIRIGHKRIAALTSDLLSGNLLDRIEGYRRSLNDAGLAEWTRVVVGGKTIEGCRAAIEQELRRPDAPTAIYATTYFATIGAVKAIQALNIAFPEEISIIGFEHSEWMTAFRPYITSMCQPLDEMANQSWRLLQRRITGASSAPERVLLPCVFSIRESARPLVEMRATGMPDRPRIPTT
jgi:LacI family transcriptional regulator